MVQGLGGQSPHLSSGVCFFFILLPIRKLVYRRRSQVAKAEVCKTFIQRFESARRLQVRQILDS